MRIPFAQNARLLFGEAFGHRRFVTVTFVLTVVAFIIAGLMWPRSYVSSATIVVDDQAIMTPLLKDEARRSGIMDRAKIAQNLVRSRYVVQQVMNNTGWLRDNPSPAAQGQMMARIRRNITVTDAGPNLVKISYKDDNPRRAYLTTQELVRLFLAETGGMRARESKAAYDFINGEVERYRQKVEQESAALTKLRANVFDASSTARSASDQRMMHLQSTHDQAMLELQEAQGRQAELQAQLQGESQVEAHLATLDAQQKELAADQQQLANLRLSYQDRYPGIVVLKSRIARLKKQIRAETSAPGYPGRQSFIDQAAANRFYQNIQHELSGTQAQIAVLKARAQETQSLLDAQQKNGASVYKGTTVSQLMRDYAVDNATLGDLLKRREDARVAMSMDKAQNGVSFRVADPADLPVNPVGPPFLVFALGGLIVGVIMPFLLVYLKAQMDERVRFAGVISDKLNLPLVAVVPHLATPVEAADARRSMQWFGIVVASMVFIVVSIVLSGNIL